MKNLLLAIGLLLTVFNGFAQEADIDPKFASYMIETERRTVFMQNMNLNDSTSKIFWVIYDEFESELKVIREAGIANLKKYADDYEKMTDEQADEIMKVSLKNEAKRAAIRKKYYAKVSKALGAKVGIRFMQLDTIINMVLKLSIYDELPLVGDGN